MTEEQLRNAVHAYLKAVDKANEALDKAKQERDEKIAQAAREQMRQRDIVRATGYSREHIRRILRAHGIEGNR